MEAGVLAAWTIILGFMGAVFQYIVLRPLNHAIENLNGAVKELRNELQTAEERRHEMELKLVEVDQRARSAHHRIDKLEGRNTDELEHR
jgi:predicted  nucleic acid-binding Zn-ribbon protein